MGLQVSGRSFGPYFFFLAGAFLAAFLAGAFLAAFFAGMRVTSFNYHQTTSVSIVSSDVFHLCEVTPRSCAPSFSLNVNLLPCALSTHHRSDNTANPTAGRLPSYDAKI